MTENSNDFVRCDLFDALFNDWNEHQDTCEICKANEELRERRLEQQKQKDRNANEPYVLFQDVISAFFKWWFSTSMGHSCPSSYVSYRERPLEHQPVASHVQREEHDTASGSQSSPESV